MTRFEITIRRAMLWLAVILLVIAFGYFWQFQATAYSACLEATQPAGWVAELRTVAAMRYHGIRFAESDADGELTFQRNGRTCQVFTEACLEAIEGGKYHGYS